MAPNPMLKIKNLTPLQNYVVKKIDFCLYPLSIRLLPLFSIMRYSLFSTFLLSLLLVFTNCGESTTASSQKTNVPPAAKKELVHQEEIKAAAVPFQLGAAQLDEYLPLLKDKKVGLVVNQTSMVGEQHLVDLLLGEGVDVPRIFAPEHGFRGKADAGGIIKDGKDAKTGIPVLSLYGKKKKPGKEDIGDLDVLVFDIQDVGARFYTYISTMHYVMEAAAENGKQVIVLDRPNPNGHYIDGPIREPAFKSFVGMHPIPVVHGLTVGELAKVINGESWLADGNICDLTVIPCQGYTKEMEYVLPVKPSPNLPNNKSIYLYPSLCFFEGTAVSIGRGTQKQFQLYGHPDFKEQMSFSFTPSPQEGASNPKHKGKECFGVDLSLIADENILAEKQLNLSYLVKAYSDFPDKENFFLKNGFINKLAGTESLMEAVKAGKSAEEIRAAWQGDIVEYEGMIGKYLLY